MLVAKAGKTPGALRVLNDLRRRRPRHELACSAALAKLGVLTEQRQLFNRFREAPDLVTKYHLAYALGHWGSKTAQQELARALRTPGLVAPWGGGGRPPEMIALHVAIALMRTVKEDIDEFPGRGCFAWTEEDFATIETWATKHLGTTWDVPRPKYYPVQMVPFLDERPEREVHTDGQGADAGAAAATPRGLAGAGHNASGRTSNSVTPGDGHKDSVYALLLCGGLLVSVAVGLCIVFRRECRRA